MKEQQWLRSLRGEKKEAIYRQILENPTISRMEMAKNLKMRANTVSDLVQELLDDGLVVETRTQPNGMRGRPVHTLKISATRFVCLSIYPEDYHLIGSLMDMAEATIAELSVELPPEATNQDFRSALDSILSVLLVKIPEGADLLGAGISLVGTVDAESKVWIEAIRWPNIKDVSLGFMERRIGAPIRLKRWQDTELEYQLMRNPACRTGNSMLLHWGTGIGVAFSHDGKVISSRFGKFADVGHTFVDSDPQRICRCGHSGCLEAVASIWALMPVFRRKYPEMQENIHDVRKVLQETDIILDPDFRYALGKVEISLANLFKLLFPDHIFFIGPFLQDSRIFREIEDTVTAIFSQKIYANIRGKVTFEVVHDQFRFCKIANVRSFFDERLRRMLEAGETGRR